MDGPYSTLADVYEWLVPDSLLEPQGCVAAFAEVVESLRPGAAILDCAAGTGGLAVGLALRGFSVVASDASDTMVHRTKSLAGGHQVELEVVRCAWDELDRRGWGRSFDAVFCVGNSLAHAVERRGRRAALAAMRGVLAPGGLLVVTSRNWERVRDRRPGLEVADRLVERHGRKALVIHSWTIPAGWDEPHELDVAVALMGDAGRIAVHAERLSFWPFRHADLWDDLRAAGMTPVASSHSADVDRYMAVARAPSGGVRIRHAGQSDARGLAGVHVRAWRAAYRGLMPDAVLDGLSVEARERRWHDLLGGGDGSAFTLVATDGGGEILGFCAVATPSRDDDAGERTAEIAALYVDPPRWRARVGTALLEAALGELRLQGFREATLWVLDGNEPARAFYRRSGFQPDQSAAPRETDGGRLEIRLRAAITWPRPAPGRR